MQIQQWVSRTLGIPRNLITERDTPVSPQVVEDIKTSGGGIYARVPGEDSVYYDRLNDQYVRLEGGQGPSADELAVHPLSAEETQNIDNEVRLQMRLNAHLGENDTGGEPTIEGPTQPYVTENEYNNAWDHADISKGGDTPLPGAPKDDVPGEPLEPGEPLPIEPEPVEPIIPIGPEDIIP